MSINELLASVSHKEMDRKDFLKVGVFAIASIVGVKSAISLLAGVDLQPDLSVVRKSANDKPGVGYNSGRYNR